MMMLRKHLPAVWFMLLAFALQLKGQQSYFADGYHGGVFGHYPIGWYTDFMVNQLEAHPEWRINLELEPETWDSVRLHTPDAYERFRGVATGRQVEVVNPAFAQPYLYNISGESIIRQFQAGMEKWHRHFPDVTFLSYSSEEPCFTSCLPTILSQLGFRYVVLKCPDTCWGGYMAPMGGEFISLTGPDGTALPCVPRYDCEALQDKSVWQTTAWKNSREYLTACTRAGIVHPVGMCLQDAGWKGGPWLKAQRGSNSEYVLWRDYFARFLPKDSLPSVSFHQENVRPALMWGSQVLQRIAQAVRKAENSLEQTERLCALAALAGAHISSDRMEEAWRTLMLSQHHDSWIVPYNRLRGHRTWADFIIGEWIPRSLHIADSLRTQALLAMAPATANAGNGQAVCVINTTGHPRREWLTVGLPEGGTCSLLAEVPAFGYVVLPLAKADKEVAPSAQKGGICVMENDRLRLELDLKKGGTIRSLRTKGDDAAEYAASDASFAFGELRGYFGKKGCFCSSTEEKASAEWLTRSEAQQTLLLKGKVAGVPFRKTITLRRGSSLVDVTLRLDWHHNQPVGEPEQKDWPMQRRGFYDTRYMLNLLLPTTLNNPQLAKDAPFDVCKSQQQETFFNRWDSIRHNVVLHWIDVASTADGRGLALFTDHTTSYSFGSDFPLALTLQYSGPGLWGRNYPIDGPSEIHYALMPHQGTWDEAHIPQSAQEWQEPLLTIPASGQAGTASHSFIACSEGLQLSAAAVKGDVLTLRLFCDGSRGGDSQSVTFEGEAKEIEEVDLSGKVVRTIPFLVQDGRSTMHPALQSFALGTYRVKMGVSHF